MELRDIELFLTLSEELHFGRTAQRMYLSTGRVSQTISALEREIGAPLFVRTSRQVSLTPLGERFRDEVSGGVRQLREAIQGAQATAAEPVCGYYSRC